MCIHHTFEIHHHTRTALIVRACSRHTKAAGPWRIRFQRTITSCESLLFTAADARGPFTYNWVNNFTYKSFMSFAPTVLATGKSRGRRSSEQANGMHDVAYARRHNSSATTNNSSYSHIIGLVHSAYPHSMCQYVGLCNQIHAVKMQVAKV